MDYFEQENSQIEKYLSDFTSREGVMLTIAGLFSLFPFANSNDSSTYFVLWVLPFLLLAIATYVCSSKRLNILRSLNGSLTSFSINSLLKERYKRSLRFHRWTDSLLVMFFAAFISSYYFSTFYGLPNLETSILLTVVAVFIGAIRYHFASKTDGESEIPGVLATGGPPADETVGFEMEK